MTDVALTPDERAAALSADQLRQLVGLVDYDESADPFPVTAFDAVVFVVGNATQTAHFYQSAFGMELVAYSGPEQGNRDHKAYVLRSGSARFVVKGGVSPDSPLLDHQRRHGDGVVDLALEVPDVDKCITHARSAGATVLEEPHDLTDEHGTVRVAAIAAYGETRHTLVDRSRYTGPYLPGFVARSSTIVRRPGAPEAHLPGDRPLRGQRRARAHGRVGLVLQPRHGLREHGGVRRRRHRHRLLGADEQGRRQRQPPGEVPPQRAGDREEEEPDRRVPRVLRGPRRPAHGAGDQRHRGAASQALRAEGIEFLDTPDSYYDDPALRERIGHVRVPIETLKEHRILVDRDEDGYLLQIFTKPVGDRPTVFFELIERHGSLGFGNGNFKALFQAIEREQDLRGR